MTRPLAPLVLLSALCLAGPAARAELIVGNLAQPSPGRVILGEAAIWIAARVDFDASFPSRTLTSATLRLGAEDRDSLWAGVELFDDAGGRPGGAVADLGVRLVTGSDQADYTFTPLAPTILDPGGSYWLVLRAASPVVLPFGLAWRTTDAATTDPGSLPGASIPGGVFYSVDAGATWQTLGGPATRFQFQLNGGPAAVPEPSTLILAGIGGLGVLGRARRRRRRA
jgi:hypothetical protein